MRFHRFLFAALAGLVLGSAARAAAPGLAGRWQLDAARSTALDGWTSAELVIQIDGPNVSIQHNMTWRQTKITATNAIDTSRATDIENFFRIDQRHMAVYAPTGKSSHVTASWIDAGRTLRVEAMVPLEVSQGDTRLRTYCEYRLLEGDDSLLLIELQSARPRPLVYHFTRLRAENERK